MFYSFPNKSGHQEAIKIAEMAEKGLGVSPLSAVELNDKALVLPEGTRYHGHYPRLINCSPASNFIWSSPLPNINQANSALTYYIHIGSIVDQRLRVTAAILTQILTEPAFNILRTKEQLGYIVSCSAWSLPGASERGIRVVIQSEKTPGYLEDRVEAFLDGMRNTIREMSAEEFEEQKSGLEKRWLETDKNLADEAGRFMVHVNSGQWDFLRSEWSS